MEPTELETVENQYWIDMAEALTRLEKNKDFQDIILQGYFKDKAINGVSMLANDGVKERGERGNIMEDLVAISNLQYHFLMIKNLGAVYQDDEDEANGPSTVV
jgi:hypothetical protein